MNLDYIREFLVFSETANYTTAAKRLFIAQPTLIQHVKKLEKDLGFQLVTHDGKPQLTELGVAFGVGASQAIKALDSTIERCRTQDRESKSRIRIINQQVILDPAFFDVSSQETASVKTTFVNFDENAYTELGILDAGEVDFSIAMAASNETPTFGNAPTTNYGFIRLKPMAGIAIMSREHPLSSKDVLRLSDLNGCNIVYSSKPFYADNTRMLEKTFDDHGITRNCIYAPSENTYLLLKADSSCLTIVVERAESHREMTMRDDDLVAIPINKADLMFYPWAIYRLDNPNPAVAEYAKRWEEFIARD